MSQEIAVLLWLHSTGGLLGEHLVRYHGFGAEDGAATRVLFQAR